MEKEKNMEQGTKKSKLKIIIPIIVIVIVVIAIFCVFTIGKKDEKFEAVASVCKIGLTNIDSLFISPELVNAWYFKDTKDVVICFSGENTSSNFYAYFMWGGDFGIDRYIGICTSTEPLTKDNIIFAEENANINKANTYSLMCEIMQSNNKLTSSQIKKLNKLIDNGKLENY